MKTIQKVSQENKELIVKVSNLEKKYNEGKSNEVHVLKGLDFDIPAGQMVAIMGPSGCGKTTLLNVIGGLDEYSSGSINLDQTELSTMDEKKLTNYRLNKIGFIFQLFNLFDSQTALENVTLPLLLQELSPLHARERAKMMLQEVGLGDKIHSYPGELSGGQQQRIAIARALITNPILLLCDEPTGDLDGSTSNDIMSLFRRTIHENPQMSAILVTHSQTIANQCDRIIRIENGTVLSDETIREVA